MSYCFRDSFLLSFIHSLKRAMSNYFLFNFLENISSSFITFSVLCLLFLAIFAISFIYSSSEEELKDSDDELLSDSDLEKFTLTSKLYYFFLFLIYYFYLFIRSYYAILISDRLISPEVWIFYTNFMNIYSSFCIIDIKQTYFFDKIGSIIDFNSFNL